MEDLPQQQNVPELPPHKGWFGLHKTSTTITVAVIVLLAATAIAYWQQRKDNDFAKTIAETEGPAFSGFKDETSNWQTYQNQKYGFEVRYPADEYILNASDDISYENTFIQNKAFLDTESANSVIIIVNSNPQKLNAKDYFVKNFQKNHNGSVFSFNGYEAFNFSLNEGVSLPKILLTQDENAYVITYIPGDPKASQILSTFKFIDAGFFDDVPGQDGSFDLGDDDKVCIQVITPARNTKTGEVRDFPTPCDVPEGWEKI